MLLRLRSLRSIVLVALIIFVVAFGARVALRDISMDLWLNRGELQNIVESVDKVLRANGTSGNFQWKENKLLEDPLGRIRGVRSDSGHLFVAVDRGGGHLGAVGLIYASEPSTRESELAAKLGLGESIRIRSVSSGWWSYK